MAFLCIIFLSGYGQENHDIHYYFESDTIAIRPKQTFSNRLIIENHSDVGIWLKPDSQNSPTLSGLIRLPDSILIHPDEIKILPFKYLADRRTILHKIQEFSLSFSSSQSQMIIQPNASFHTILQQSTKVILQTEQDEYYLDPTGDPIQIQIRCTNSSLIPISFQVSMLDNSKSLQIDEENQWVTLDAGMQTILPFTVYERSPSTMDYQIQIRAEGENGELLSQKQIRIITSGSNKRYPQNLGFDPPPSPVNMAGIRYTNMNQNYSIMQFLSHGDFDLKEDHGLQYRLHLDHYPNQSTIKMFNSYLNYNTTTWSIKAGNIFDNLDHHIGGRGLKTTYKINENHAFSLYGVENEYLLFGQGSGIPGAKIFAGHYSFTTLSDKEGQITVLHRDDPYRLLKSNQIHGKTFISPKSGGELFLEGGYSLESSSDPLQKHSFSAGADYQKSFGSYRLITQNYFSSPYYTGIRRGVGKSDSRLIRSFSKNQSGSLRVNIINNQPRFHETDIGYRYHRNDLIQIYELGYKIFSRHVSLDIKPYFIQQHLHRERDFFSEEEIKWDSRSIRTTINMNIFQNHHRLSLNTDYGYTFYHTTELPDSHYHSLRAFGNYNYRFLGVSSYVQINPYYLTDLFSMRDTESYRHYSIGPHFHITTLENRLDFRISSFYNYHSISSSKNFSLNGNAFWQFSPKWKLTADLYYSNAQFDTKPEELLTPEHYDYIQFSIGLEKKLHRSFRSKGHKLQLTLFEDHNNNGVHDIGEPIIEGALVKIDDVLATTNSKGMVHFSGIPAGAYTLQIINQRGWILPDDYKISISNNQSLTIPLVKTKRVRGSIHFNHNKYENLIPSLSGIEINATNPQGKNFKTYTDQKGEFTFYLPIGKYTIWIETKNRPYSSLQKSFSVTINGDEIRSPDIRFDLQDNRRQIRVKKF